MKDHNLAKHLAEAELALSQFIKRAQTSGENLEAVDYAYAAIVRIQKAEAACQQ